MRPRAASIPRSAGGFAFRGAQAASLLVSAAVPRRIFNFVAARASSASCRRQQAGSLCSPGFRVLLSVWIFGLTTSIRAAEVIPPKPDRYFNDYAHVVSTEAGSRFNEQLAQFERDTSNQIVVAVFPKMQTDSDIADYTQRIAQSWGVGQKDRRNGAVLFIFIQDRKMFIQVGYGLEGALPDITAFDITEYRIKPRFRTGDYEGGIAEGIRSMIKAVQGEYKGTGRTVRERAPQQQGSQIPFIVFFFIFVIALILMSRMNRTRGYRYSSLGGPYYGGWSGGSGGGWSSGGGGGGFSGFSGGGGSFGGGGAGSSW